MKIILRQRVENLGGPGDIVSVKNGYARNYLIPRRLALPHTPGNLKRFEHDRQRLAAQEVKIKTQAEELAARYAGAYLRFVRKAGAEGVLYGSVTPAAIVEALAELGLHVDKKYLIIGEQIKRIGDFVIAARLHPEVDLEIMVTVEPEGGELQPLEAAEEPSLETEAGAEEERVLEEESGPVDTDEPEAV